jgi:hypothetical protein
MICLHGTSAQALGGVSYATTTMPCPREEVTPGILTGFLVGPAHLTQLLGYGPATPIGVVEPGPVEVIQPGQQAFVLFLDHDMHTGPRQGVPGQ